MSNEYTMMDKATLEIFVKAINPLREAIGIYYKDNTTQLNNAVFNFYENQGYMVLENATSGNFLLKVNHQDESMLDYLGFQGSFKPEYLRGKVFTTLKKLVDTSPVPIKQISFEVGELIKSGGMRPSLIEAGSFEIGLFKNPQKSRKSSPKIKEKEKAVSEGTLDKKPVKKAVRAKKAEVEKIDRYLTMVDAGENNYKYYSIKVNGDTFEATWGRMGVTGRVMAGNKVYPIKDYSKKYNEKIAKGYKDRTEILTSSGSDESTSASKEATMLYNFLLKYSKERVHSTLVSDNLTKGMVEHSRKLLNDLYNSNDIRSFNNVLLELMAICPRKVDKVESQLAKSRRDIPFIFDREEDLQKAMEGVVGNGGGTLDADVLMATDEQREQVLDKLSDKLKPKVVDVYRVKPNRQQVKFDNYIKQRNITKIKQLWHGSRNENWISIIRNSLSLSPNAQITGKMFGNGIYFAPSSMKSWGYTSGDGAYWTGGGSKDAVMGLYATAYGEPHITERAGKFTEDTIYGKDCVHAKAGSQLRNDEIIYYNEAAMVLNYIVTFKC
jgi:poly [ADP-ribose] polymerase